MSDKTADAKAPGNREHGRRPPGRFRQTSALLKSSSIDSDGTIRVRLDFRKRRNPDVHLPGALVVKAASMAWS